MLSSCGNNYRLYQGSVLPKDQVAILINDPPSLGLKGHTVVIISVDGSDLKPLETGLQTIELLPGLHHIKIYNFNEHRTYSFGAHPSRTIHTRTREETVSLDARPGHTYKVEWPNINDVTSK
jgi:hypothetical protein